MRAFLHGAAILTIVLLTTTPLLSADDPSVGVKLLRQLWENFKDQDIAALKQLMAPGFQAVHQDGGRDREQELKLLENLDLGEYALSDIEVTRDGPVIITTYFVTTAETIAGERLLKKRAARLTAFLDTDDGWKWIAHANLTPLEK